MKMPISATISFTVVGVCVTSLADDSLKTLKDRGAFGFPQSEATVMCDNEDLRVSAWNDAEHLVIQAVLWNDGDDTVGTLPDGRSQGDTSSLTIDADADGKPTPEIDCSYRLNEWPSKPGLWYSRYGPGGFTATLMAEGLTQGLSPPPKDRGSIQYVETGVGTVRVDTFVISLDALYRKPGQRIRFSYYGYSPSPEMTVNSVGFQASGRYYESSFPWKSFHTFFLSMSSVATMDVEQVPNGRK